MAFFLSYTFAIAVPRRRRRPPIKVMDQYLKCICGSILLIYSRHSDTSIAMQLFQYLFSKSLFKWSHWCQWSKKLLKKDTLVQDPVEECMRGRGAQMNIIEFFKITLVNSVNARSICEPHPQKTHASSRWCRRNVSDLWKNNIFKPLMKMPNFYQISLGNWKKVPLCYGFYSLKAIQLLNWLRSNSHSPADQMEGLFSPLLIHWSFESWKCSRR